MTLGLMQQHSPKFLFYFLLIFFLRETLRNTEKNQLWIKVKSFTFEICSYPGMLNVESKLIINWTRIHDTH